MTYRSRVVAVLAVAALVGLGAQAVEAGPLGPTPYTSFASSPFFGGGFSYFHLENFEALAGSVITTPGVAATSGTRAGGPGGAGFGGTIIDSVLGDGACPQASAPTPCNSWFGSGTPGISFAFSAGVLGALPTHAGIVWTDGSGTTSFQAYGPGDVLLGSIGPVSIADGSFMGTTAEDHFFGWTDPGGIYRIHISNTSGGIELDHLQYGLVGTGPGHGIPAPATLALVGLGLATLGALSARRRRP